MTKLFLDTNVWLRYFLKDNEQYEAVEQLLHAIDEGKFLSYTSSIVFLEIVFVLGKTYNLSDDKILKYLTAIREVRNITLIEKTDSGKALHYFNNYHPKYSDCLIASQLAEGMILVTYDHEFSKIKGLILKTPAEIISGLKS